MAMSRVGSKMAALSGLRSIMEDIDASTAGAGAAQWLNLSIGNPAPIPEVIATWRRLAEEAMAEGFAEASCHYGPTRGVPSLVSAIADYFNQQYGWGIAPENIIVGPGSQMLCFIASALYAGPGTAGNLRVLLPLTPDYTGYQGLCMNTGGIAGAQGVVHADDDHYFHYGYDFAALKRRAAVGMMLLSSPANPTGRCIDAAELAFLTGMAERRNIPLLIDHAYGEPFPRIGQSLTPPAFHPNVISSFSLSKAGLPGERIGFAIGPERFISPMVSFLANSSLHAGRLAQLAVAAGLRSGRLDAAVSEVIRPFYAGRRQLAESLLLSALPGAIDWRMHSCPSGMFCWLWINERWFDDLELYRLLKEKQVFIAPGRNFFVAVPGRGGLSGHATRCFRISLTVGADMLAEGIRRIAEALTQLKAAGRGRPQEIRSPGEAARRPGYNSRPGDL